MTEELALALARNRCFYERLIERYGDQPAAVGWSPANQARRFEALASIGDLRQATVADFGCGRGDLYGWLEQHGGCFAYRGYECHPRLLAMAQAAHPDSAFAEAETTQQIEPADYVLLSGVFNLNLFDESRHHWDWMIDLLDGAYTRASRGVAFNCLSAYTDAAEQDDDQFYTDPHRLLQVCLRLTPRVRVFHWDLPRNMTVHLLK